MQSRRGGAPGRVTVDYHAVVRGTASLPEPTDAERVTFLRPSRYAESDRLFAVARGEFAGIGAGADRGHRRCGRAAARR